MVPFLTLSDFRVQAAREALRLSIEEAARRSGISEKTMRRIEAGTATNRLTGTLAKLQKLPEQEGVTLILDDVGPEGPGVRYRPRRQVGSPETCKNEGGHAVISV